MLYILCKYINNLLVPDIVLASGVQLRTAIPSLLEMTVCYIGANKTNKQANSIIFYKMLSVGWKNKNYL